MLLLWHSCRIEISITTVAVVGGKVGQVKIVGLLVSGGRMRGLCNCVSLRQEEKEMGRWCRCIRVGWIGWVLLLC